MGEKWVSVVGHEGWYEISDLGRTRRSRPGGSNTFVGRIYKPRVHKRGYLEVSLSIDGKKYYCRVHRLVAEAFIGPCPDGMEVNHKDGDKLNNTPENLEYITHADNVAHAHATGLHDNKGEKHPLSKLTESNVHEIRRLFGKETHEAIAKRFGVCRATISLIASGKNWSSLKDEDGE